MFSRVFLFAGFLVGLLIVAGCARTNTVAQKTPTKVSDVPTIQKSTAFAKATNAFHKGEIPIALAQIQTLQTQTDLTTADKLFLQRQVALCKQALQQPKGKARQGTTVVNTTKKQTTDSADCGAQALFFVCRQLDIPASLPALTKAAGTKPGVGANMAGMANAAKTVGLTATGVQVDADALKNIKPPAIAWVDGDHYVAVTQINDKKATIFDSNKQGKEEVTTDTLLQRSGGVLLLIKPTRNVTN